MGMLGKSRIRMVLMLALLAGAFIVPGAFAQEGAEVVEAAAAAVEKAAAPSAAEAAALAEAQAAAAEAGDYSVDYADADEGDFSVVIVDTVKFTVDNLWILLAGCLVFLMHLGFAMVESGLTRAKNTVNILFKNSMIICIGFLAYGLMGFNLHYPGFGDDSSGWFAFGGFGFLAQGSDILNDPSLMTASGYELDMTTYADFFFQAMFCATGATIISGAVCGRIKLLPFLLFTTFFTTIVYPLVGSWHWGGGYLNKLATPVYDFAGSTVVHGVGGWGALIGAIVLGPRLGKYAKDGHVQPIPGHNMPLVTIGVFLLWFGWFGFNGGSELSADPAGVSYVLVTTSFAACGGGIAAAICSWIFAGKPDLSMTLNGILAGLVGITAGPDVPSWIGALVICGFVPGVLVYFSVLFFDKLKIDDPVGAISVHGVCGIYGTLAVAFSGVFEGNIGNFGVQAIGAFAGAAFAFVLALVLFVILKATLGLRVSEAEEIEGLDLGEHDMSAYPDFQRTFIKSYHAREL